MSGGDCEEGVMDCVACQCGRLPRAFPGFASYAGELGYQHGPYPRYRTGFPQESVDSNEVETDASGGLCAIAKVVKR